MIIINLQGVSINNLLAKVLYNLNVLVFLEKHLNKLQAKPILKCL